MKTLLITGLSGFVGQHLQAHLQDHPQWQILLTEDFDLCDPHSLDRALEPACPDAVIHLAGQTFVPEAVRNPARTFEVNLLGTLNLLQALKKRGFQGSFLYVSSGDVYGQVAEQDLPITEQLMPKPRNPYAVSKLAAELLCQQWAYSEPWNIIIVRPFNHIGPKQSANFVIPSVAKQLADIHKGRQKPVIEMGDIDVSRDFLDVRDVINAYLLLLEKGHTGETYNLCSKQEIILRTVIAKLTNLSDIRVEIMQDQSKIRKSEQRRVVGNYDKLQQHTGWRPAHSLDASLQAILEEWMAKD